MTLRWTLLVPLRMLPAAKSRLAATLHEDEHGVLVRAIRTDTLHAAGAAAPVARVVVVTDGDGVHPDADVVVVQSAPGLNGALRDGAAHAASHWPADGIAALVGDLPALRPEELAAALAAAAGHARSFVPDADGTGTTMLAARPGTALDPRFGPGSAARHRATAAALTAGPGLRHDVDTVEDLHAARRHGVGPATRAALERMHDGIDGVVSSP